MTSQVGLSRGGPADLRAAQGEPVVVELFAEPHPVRPTGVEGQIHHRALGRAARSAWANASGRPRHWNTTSAPWSSAVRAATAP